MHPVGSVPCSGEGSELGGGPSVLWLDLYGWDFFLMNLVSHIPCIIRGNCVLETNDCLGIHLGPAITSCVTPGKSVLPHL